MKRMKLEGQSCLSAQAHSRNIESNTLHLLSGLQVPFNNPAKLKGARIVFVVPEIDSVVVVAIVAKDIASARVLAWTIVDELLQPRNIVRRDWRKKQVRPR